MSVDHLSEAAIEAELARLARSRMSASALQPRVAALRTILKRRERERLAIERQARDEAREKHHEERDSGGGEVDAAATALAWLDVDIGPDMYAALGYGPLAGARRPVPPAVERNVNRDANRIMASADPLAEWEKWKARYCPPS